MKFRTVDRHPGSGRRSARITSTQLSRCCWVRKTNLRATKQSEKFHARRVYYPSVISFADYSQRSKRSKKRTEACTRYFSVWCSLRDDNVTIRNPTWKMKHANSIVESFEYFCRISSKSIHIISSNTIYTISIWPIFWNTVYYCVNMAKYSIFVLVLSEVNTTLWRDTFIGDVRINLRQAFDDWTLSQRAQNHNINCKYHHR